MRLIYKDSTFHVEPETDGEQIALERHVEEGGPIEVTEAGNHDLNVGFPAAYAYRSLTHLTDQLNACFEVVTKRQLAQSIDDFLLHVGNFAVWWSIHYDAGIEGLESNPITIRGSKACSE